MAEISTTVANNTLRADVTAQVMEWAKEHFDSDCLQVANNEFTMPAINSKGEELYINISITIPKGERDSVNHCYLPYDGYAAADAYQAEVAKKEDAARVKAEAAALKRKRSRRKKDADEEPAQYLDREVTV